MPKYTKTVVATDSNVVTFTIYRDGIEVFSEDIEPVNIGFIRGLLALMFIGTPKLQEMLLKKAHKLADLHIKVMLEFEIWEK